MSYQFIATRINVNASGHNWFEPTTQPVTFKNIGENRVCVGYVDRDDVNSTVYAAGDGYPLDPGESMTVVGNPAFGSASYPAHPPVIGFNTVDGTSVIAYYYTGG